MTKTKISKWGNSYGVRIPKTIMDSFSFIDAQEFILSISSGRIIMTPVKRRPTLDEYLSRITDESRHPELNNDPPQGREIW